MLRNSLKSLLDPDDMDSITSVSLDKRPEELSIDEFIELTEEISSKSVKTK